MTPRPRPDIPRENRVDDLRAHLDSVLPRFEALPGVVGVTLDGGLARGYGDELSEIDVTLYLTDEGGLPLDTWESTYGLGLLASEPFATVAAVDGDDVVLYEAALDAVRPETIFDWHYEVVAVVRERTGE